MRRVVAFVFGVALISGAAYVVRSEPLNRPGLDGRISQRDGVDDRLLYFYSSSMPLSVRGRAEVGRAATALGMPATIVHAGQLVEPDPRIVPEELRHFLLESGTTLHYPSAVLVRGNRILGHAVLGYRTADVYEDLFLRARDEIDPPATPGASFVSATGTPMTVLREWRVSPPVGAFYRSIPGTKLYSFDRGGRTFLGAIDDTTVYSGPGSLDLVPTPDGRLFVTPDPAAGLTFYEIAEVLQKGRRQLNPTFTPIFVDTTMIDQYPSAGMIRTTAESTTYRVVVSWLSGLAFRDYEVRWSTSGVVVVPLARKGGLCQERRLSLPILSATGLELVARDDSTGTTRVFALSEDGRKCSVVLDLGLKTGKATLDRAGNMIAFSAPDPYEPGRPITASSYILDRRSGESQRIPGSRSLGLTIPEFVGNDSVLVASRLSTDPRVTTFRLLCCVDSGVPPGLRF